MTSPPRHSATTTLTGIALLALVGAVVGTLGDQIHVQFGVLDYAHPYLLGQAIWVPFLFAGAGLFMVHSHRVWKPRPTLLSTQKPETKTLGASSLVSPALWFVAAYFSTGIFKDQPIALAIGLTVAWALRVAVAPSWELALTGLSFALGGPLFEAALASTGAFRYLVPSSLGVPIWLPGLYLHVSLLTRAIYLYAFAPQPEPKSQ